MIKIIKNKECIYSDKSGLHIPIGTTFYGKINDIEGLFLRTYSGIVFLENPEKTWGFFEAGAPTIENYQEVDIEIKVCRR